PPARPGTEQQFPGSVAYRKTAVDRLAHEAIPDRPGILTEQRRKETDTVLARVLRKRTLQQIRNCRQEIKLPDELMRDSAGRNLRGPAHEKGDAVTAFVEVGLVTAEMVARMMPHCVKFGKLRLR